MLLILLSTVAMHAACSTVPQRAWPPFDERTVTAAFPWDGASPIELPVSSDVLTILSLQIEPSAVVEYWQGGKRLVRPPDGCREITVTCSYRAYAKEGSLPTPHQVFHGARVQVTNP